MFSFKKIPFHKIVLIIIIIVALGFRLYQIDKSVWLQTGYDESRDMLVASHIVENKEHVSRGPYVAGGFEQLKNSPIYYYFVALIWFFTRTPNNLMYAWSLIMTLPVLIGYFIGKKSIDIRTGLILASLVAVNQFMISSSRELLQPHLLLIFSMSYIFFALSFIKDKKNKLLNLNLMIFFSMISLHFHYGVIFVLPAALFFIAHCWFVLNTHSQKTSSKNLLAPIFLFLFLFLLWIMMTYRIFPFDQIYFFISNFQRVNDLSFLEQLNLARLSLDLMIWGYDLSKFGAILSIISILVLILGVSHRYKNKIKIKKFKKIIVFLFFVASSVFLLGFYKGDIAETYLLFILPFFIVLIAFSLRLIIKQSSFFGWLITIVAISFMVLNSSTRIFYPLPTVSYHEQQREVAKKIFDHYATLVIDDARFLKPNLLVTWYVTEKTMPFDGWGTSGIWYYLEEYFQQPLVKNTSYGLNHTPINKYPKILYLICDRRISPELIQQDCIDSFIKLHPLLNNELEPVFNEKNFSVWSVKVDASDNFPIVNAVNYDLLKK